MASTLRVDRLQKVGSDPIQIDGYDAITKGNLLGVVSQTGGIPTGAVVERGSNANGEYVRFADGTQICWGGGIFNSKSTEYQLYTYPAAFITGQIGVQSIGVSLAFGNSDSRTEDGQNCVAYPTELQWRLRTWKVGEFNDNPVIMTAIGRWF